MQEVQLKGWYFDDGKQNKGNIVSLNVGFIKKKRRIQEKKLFLMVHYLESF